MTQHRVLIGACGGLTGSYLSRKFKEKGCYVLGADTTPNNVTKYFVDDFVIIPEAGDSEFLNELIRILNAYRIDCYIPTHSKEIRTVSYCEEELRVRWSGNFMVCPYSTFQMLDNKLTANKSLMDIGIPVPKVIEGFEQINYPIFMKPDRGSGSKRSQVIESKLLHAEYRRLYPDVSFYQQIKGTEYTVDCMYDMDGNLLGYNSRIRVKSMGGAVIITENSNDYDIKPYLDIISSKFLFRGCVNFQYIVSEGKPYFIDVNLRYASGGLPLTVESGIDVPQIMLGIFSGKKVECIHPEGTEHKIMYRYFEELFDDN